MKKRVTKKFVVAASILLYALPPALPTYAQNAITLPIAAQAVADIGNGPIKVRVTQGNASIFTAQGSGVGSTAGSSTTLTLTSTPATPPLVGGYVSGTGITSGTTVAAYNGTTGITLSAAMNVAASTAVSWGAACPASAAGIPSQRIQASVMADYYLLYTQARVCAISPGGPANALLILPVFYESTTPGGGGGGGGAVSSVFSRTGAVTAQSGDYAIGQISGFGTGVSTALGVSVGTAGAFVVNGGVLGTPTSGVATNLTGLPISTGLSGAGTGVLTALGVNVGSAGAIVVNGGALGTPSSGVAANLTGLPVATGVSGLGTGVATALGVNVGSAGAFVTFNGALGTPSSGVATNLTGLPISTGLTGAGTGVVTALGVNVGTAGAFVVNGGVLGTPSSGVATNLTGLPISTGLTGAGTGVLTALGVNVGSAGAFIVNGGALGTPSSGVATNLTGTAAGLTAGNVTTNANLTGPITSTGNATAIASQTGTGNTFVMSAAPTITGAMGASGTLAVGGCTIGANGFCVTGTSSFSGAISGTSITLTSTMSSGANGGIGGQVTLNGATSGSGVVKVAAAAGAGIVFQIPSSNGSNGNVLTTNGSGVTSWGAGGGVTTTYPLSGTTALTFIGALDQGRLTYTNTTTLTFSPYKGDLIKIAGVVYQIPSAGVACSNSGLSDTTLYYVYLYMVSTTVTCELSTTARATDTTAGNIGVEIKNGDNSRSLIGLVRTVGSNLFANSATQRLVVSWLNKRAIGSKNFFTADRGTTSATLTEINTEIRVEFLTWSDEAVAWSAYGAVRQGTGNNGTYTAVAFDSTSTPETYGVRYTALVAGGGYPNIFALGANKSDLSEGFHYFTLLGAAPDGNTTTYDGGSANTDMRTVLSVGIRG